ncbi:MAG: hypothetical protein ACEPO2_06855 [Pelagibaca sp.]
MIGTIRHLWAHHRLLVLAFGLAVLLTVFFALRLALATLYWSDPAHFQQPPERWMTPGYVARSWQVSPQELATALGLDPNAAPRRQTLDDIAAVQGRPVGTLIAELTLFLSAQQP